MVSFFQLHVVIVPFSILNNCLFVLLCSTNFVIANFRSLSSQNRLGKK